MSSAPVRPALAALAACIAVGGCSSTSSSEGPSGTDLCGSADALRSSVGALRDVQIREEGADALRLAFAEVGDDVARLTASARDEYATQVADVESSVGALGTAIDAVGSSPSAATLSAAGTATRALVEDAGVLVDAVRASC